MHYFGIDVSQQASAICVVGESGQVTAETTVATEAGALERWLRAHGPGRAVIEAAPLAEWLAQVIEAAGHEVVVVDSRSAKRLMQSRKKTDRRDARTLAAMARTGWYQAVHRKSEAARLLRSRLQARQGLLRTARGLQQRIRGLLRAHGIKVGAVSDGAFEARIRELAQARVPTLLPALEGLLAGWRVALQEVRRLERALKREARRHPVTRLMMATPGVGPLTALSTVATIDDPWRFRRDKQVADYPGLTPGVYQSGEVDGRGRITRDGDSLWRFHLVEAAHALLTRGADCELKRWGQRLAERKGGAKARVAVARKLAILLWRQWRDGMVFEAEPSRA